MAHAYTPGLRVSPRATVLKQRRLPLKGEVLVEKDQRLQRDQVVARTELPGDVTSVNLVNRLGIMPEELPSYMLVKEGDDVEAGTPLAATQPLIKWFKTTVEAPVSGTVENVSSVTGQVILRQPPRPVEVAAFVDGVVVDLLPAEGVTVETRGAYVQGIFGIGGECWGPLRILAQTPADVLEECQITEDCTGQILVGGGLLTLAVIERAQKVGARGLIGGGLHDRDLRSLLGFDLGVAITGTEEIGLTLIVTEGFGDIAMARRTFDVLNVSAGRVASISGATQIRAGVMRPEIIVPQEDGSSADADSASGGGLEIGRTVRAIRAPYFGRIGRVSDLPSGLIRVESGAEVRVLEVEFEDHTRSVIPRANVELIEE